MRKIKLIMITGILAGTMVFAAGCGSKAAQDTTQKNTEKEINSVNTSEEATEETTEEATEETTEKSTEEKTENNTEEATEEATEGIQYDSTDGLPPVDNELKQFYKKAETLFLDVVFSRIECDTEDSVYENIDADGNKMMYSRVTDSKYPTMNALKSELRKYFTEEMVIELTDKLINGLQRFKEIDGKLYRIQDGKGGNIMYAGHVFEKVILSGDTMQMPVKVYYAKNATPYEIFYTTPEDLDAYDVKSFTQTLVKESGWWRFSRFELMY